MMDYGAYEKETLAVLANLLAREIDAGSGSSDGLPVDFNAAAEYQDLLRHNYSAITTAISQGLDVGQESWLSDNVIMPAWF